MSLNTEPTTLDMKPKGKKGPGGDLLLPRILPLEAQHIINIIPPFMRVLDGTPGRINTFGDNKWLRENHEWVEKNLKALNANKKFYWTDSNFESAEDAKKIAKSKEIVDYAVKPSTDDDDAENDMDWICLCRPYWDKQEERYRDGDDSEDESDEDAEDEEQEDTNKRMDSTEANNGSDKEGGSSCASKKRCTKGKDCLENKPGDEHPDWPWVFTRKGLDRYRYWFQEASKRDQESFGFHFYSDFTGLGILEVMENQLLVLDQEFSKKPSMDLWSEFEGIGLFLQGDIEMWWNCEDGLRVADIAGLWGAAVLEAIERLISIDEFKADSQLRNMGLVLSLFLKFTNGIEEQNNECDWTVKAVALAKEHGIKLEGPFNMGRALEQIENKWGGNGSRDDSDYEEYINWKKTGWRDGFKEYSKRHARSENRRQAIRYHEDV